MKLRKLPYIAFLFILLISSVSNLAAQDSTYPDFNFSFTIGSDGYDLPYQLASDSQGNIVLVGRTSYPVYNTGVSGPPTMYQGPFYDISPDFQTYPISNSNYSWYGGSSEGIITKLDPSGDIIWSGYWGGNHDDAITSIAIDADDNIIIVGKTRSTNFVLKNAYQTELKGINDGFVTKFDPDGNVIFSTLIGGAGVDFVNRVIIDKGGGIVVIGGTKSDDFPLLRPFDSTFEGDQYSTKAFVTKFSSKGEMVFSTYFGGSNYDNNYALAIGSLNEINIAGVTKSDDIPTYVAPDPEFNGKIDVFMAQISDGGKLNKATFLGGFLGDWIHDMVIDDEDNLYLTGYSNSNDFPIIDGDDDELNNGIGIQTDIIVAKVGKDYFLDWSTFIGGSEVDEARAMSMDEEGNIVIVGTTKSHDFPIVGYDGQFVFNNRAINREEEIDTKFPFDITISKVNPSGQLIFSTVFGGASDDVGVDIAMNGNDAYILARTLSPTVIGTDVADLALDDIIVTSYTVPKGINPRAPEVATNSGFFSFISLEDPVTQVILGSLLLFVAYRVYKLVRKPKISDDQQKWKADLNTFFDKMNEL